MVLQIYIIIILLSLASSTWNPLTSLECLPDEIEDSPPVGKTQMQNIIGYLSQVLEILLAFTILSRLVFRIAKHYYRYLNQTKGNLFANAVSSLKKSLFSKEKNVQYIGHGGPILKLHRSKSEGAFPFILDKVLLSNLSSSLQSAIICPKKRINYTQENSFDVTQTPDELPLLSHAMPVSSKIAKESEAIESNCLESKCKVIRKSVTKPKLSPINSPRKESGFNKANSSHEAKRMAFSPRKQMKRDITPTRCTDNLAKNQAHLVEPYVNDLMVVLGNLEREIKILQRRMAFVEKEMRDTISLIKKFPIDLATLRTTLKEDDNAQSKVDKDSAENGTWMIESEIETRNLRKKPLHVNYSILKKERAAEDVIISKRSTCDRLQNNANVMLQRNTLQLRKVLPLFDYERITQFCGIPYQPPVDLLPISK